MSLSQADLRHIRAAVGYLELGMPLEAYEETENIAAGNRHLREVSVVQLEIFRTLKKWEPMQAIASRLAKQEPEDVQWAISWAYATRRADSLEAAKRILEHALERHPNEAIIHFNLACYAAQMGVLHEAKMRLETATQLEPACKAMALTDDDLEPLRASLGST